MSAVFEEMAEQNYKILISDIEEGVLRVVTFLDFAFSPGFFFHRSENNSRIFESKITQGFENNSSTSRK